MNPETLVIGLDWAVDPKNRGLALGVVDPAGELRVKEVRSGEKDEKTEEAVTERIGDAHRVLICLDAPLGWPESLPRILAGHAAGAALKSAHDLQADPDEMFSRRTDWHVAGVVGKRPLEVGADRIARAAVSALLFLETLRAATGAPWPLAREQGGIAVSSVIEVYPAGTLCAWKKKPGGYKGSGDAQKKELIGKRREKIADWLIRKLPGLEAFKGELESEHNLDATLCLLAGRDFLRGRCLPPPDGWETIEKEGWIWVRDPRYTPGENFCKKAKSKVKAETS